MKPQLTLLSAIGVLVALSLSCSRRADEPTETQQRPSSARVVTVDATVVETMTVERVLEAVGSLRASERIVVSSEIAGVVRSVHFEEGEMIEGESDPARILFRLDTDLLELEVDNAAARLALAEAEVAEKREVYERKKRMWEDEATTEASYVDSKLALDRSLAAKRQADAAVAIARERLSKADIRAPIGGLVGERQVGPGDYVDPGEPMVELVQADPVEVSFSLPERYRPLLRKGLEVRVRSDAIGDEVVSGTVFFVAPAADPSTRSIRLKARLPNPDWRLPPGVFAKVSLVVGEGLRSVVVPEEAIVPRGERFYVYTVEKSRAEAAATDGEGLPKARRREVSLGQRLPGKVVVTSGLSGAETVVVAGLQMVSDGYPVQVREGGKG